MDDDIVSHLASGLSARLTGGAARPWTGPVPSRPAVAAIMAADAPGGPAALTGAPQGLLFELRTIGGLVPPSAGDGMDRSVGAALEFAVRIVGVRDIVLIGHTGSAFIRTLVADATPAAGALVQGDFLASWTAMLAPAVQRALGPGVASALRPRICAQEIMRVSIENLMTYPWIVDAVLAGTLRLHGWYVDEAGGGFEILDPDSDDFVPDRGA